MAVQTETLQVAGIRCERCVLRLADALRDQPGLEFANANLMGQLTLSWDEDQTGREALVGVLVKAGFPPATPV